MPHSTLPHRPRMARLLALLILALLSPRGLQAHTAAELPSFSFDQPLTLDASGKATFVLKAASATVLCLG
ncbi:MAG TPA: hypothetical protein VGR07_02870, partial [Thermoanaerobaculia bacterium]|nr:hypothetical protein [Thermoanaerobaculia bacterium]